MTEELFSVRRLKCECALEQGIGKLDRLLVEAKAEMKKKRHQMAINKMEARQTELKADMKRHKRFLEEYARDLVDLEKSRTFNVGPSQQKLQTIPYLVGKEKRDQDAQVEEKKKKKRRR